MRMHTRTHWIAVALVLAALLLTLNEAHGQSAGAAATFEGRPAMAGPQGGIGAQAGLPQGGIGVQGAQAAERKLPLRSPAAAADAAPQAAGPRPDVAAARKEVARPKDTGLAREERSAVQKTKRAAKRTVQRSRTGVGEIDTGARTGG